MWLGGGRPAPVPTARVAALSRGGAAAAADAAEVDGRVRVDQNGVRAVVREPGARAVVALGDKGAEAFDLSDESADVLNGVLHELLVRGGVRAVTEVEGAHAAQIRAGGVGEEVGAVLLVALPRAVSGDFGAGADVLELLVGELAGLAGHLVPPRHLGWWGGVRRRCRAGRRRRAGNNARRGQAAWPSMSRSFGLPVPRPSSRSSSASRAATWAACSSGVHSETRSAVRGRTGSAWPKVPVGRASAIRRSKGVMRRSFQRPDGGRGGRFRRGAACRRGGSAARVRPGRWCSRRRSAPTGRAAAGAAAAASGRGCGGGSAGPGRHRSAGR